MKIKQIQEASYHNQSGGWCFEIEIDYQSHTCGPFSTEEEAVQFMGRIQKAAVDSGSVDQWYEEREFDFSSKASKLMTPNQVADYLAL